MVNAIERRFSRYVMATCAPDSCGLLVKGDAGNGINLFGSQLLPPIRDATSQTERWIDKA